MYTKLASSLLSFIMLFFSLSCTPGDNVTYEYDGSVFHTFITDAYIYSSQLTPYGYYSFAFGYRSNDILTGIIHISELDIDFDPFDENTVFDTYTSSILRRAVLDNIDDFATERVQYTVMYYPSRWTIGRVLTITAIVLVLGAWIFLGRGARR